MLLWAVGTRLQRLAVSWLILTMTGSAFQVALAFGLYFMPNLLLGPFCGAVADRVNRKALLVAVQSLNLLASMLLTFIVIADVAQVWSVLGIALLFGIGMSFGIPTTQALVYDVVGPRDAHNAIALQSVVMRFVGAIGAVAGGILIETVGFGAAFLAAASSYGLGLLTISFLGHRPIQRSAQATSVMSNLIEGFKLFVGTRFLAIILVMAMVAEVFGYGAIALLPVIAGEEVLGVGAGGLGIMNGAMSLGATLGALSLASSAELRHKGMTLMVAFLFCGLMTGGYSQANVFPLTVLLLAGFGLAQGIFDTLEVILLQQNVPDEMRGRIYGGMDVLHRSWPNWSPVSRVPGRAHRRAERRGDQRCRARPCGGDYCHQRTSAPYPQPGPRRRAPFPLLWHRLAERPSRQLHQPRVLRLLDNPVQVVPPICAFAQYAEGGATNIEGLKLARVSQDSEV